MYRSHLHLRFSPDINNHNLVSAFMMCCAVCTSLPLALFVYYLSISAAVIPTTSSTLSITNKSSSQPASPLSGTINQPDDDRSTNLTILVASASDGSITEVAPVISRKSFTLHKLALHDGRHLLTVIGSTQREYNTIIATIRDGMLNATFSRSLRRHALVYPADEHLGTSVPQLHFYACRHTDFDRGRKKKSNSLWDWFMFIFDLPSVAWRHKFYVSGAFAVVFLLWFPHVFHKLPPEMREELTGEKEPDLGDPNRVIKALLGEDAFSVKRNVSGEGVPR